VFAAFLGFATPGLRAADMILPQAGGDDTTAVDRLAAECGVVLPTASTPLSKAAMQGILQTIGQRAGDTAANDELLAMSGRLRAADLMSVGVSVDLVYERYLLPASRLPSVDAFGELVQVLDPLGLLRMSYQLDNRTELVISAEVRREYSAGVVDSNLFASAADNPIAIENNDITEGYLRFGGGALEVTFGRQKMHIGPSPANSLMISSRIPFMDALNLKGSFGPLRMTLLVSTLENREASPDVVPGAGYGFRQTVILCNAHYFEYAFRKVRLGIGGMYLVVRPGNAFHLADFFPVMSWHQADLTPNNLSLVADLSVAPVAGMTVYLQAGVDDINLNFTGVGDSGIPTIPAVLAGARWDGRVRDFRLGAWVEGGYTHYLWGNFIDGAAMARAIYRMDTDVVLRSMPLTSPYGPGSIWATGSVSVETPWRLEGGLRIRYVATNTSANLTTTPYAADPVIASAPLSHWLQVALGVRWRPLDAVWVSATPEVDLRDGEVWGGVTLAGGVQLAGTWPVVRPPGP
jgi:hypothetical protein